MRLSDLRFRWTLILVTLLTFGCSDDPEMDPPTELVDMTQDMPLDTASDVDATIDVDAEMGAEVDAGMDAGADIDAGVDAGVDANPDGRPVDWTEETHSRDVDPNIEEVFSDTEVKRIDIVFSADEWATMIADMTNIYGEPGGRPQQGGFSDQDPVFVPADILYKDRTWTHVGVRFKGNSSLMSTWSSGNLKLSFKLDFDEFEDDFPEIDNQRFYGIKKLSLKNNFDDASLVRDKVMADLFADAGMAVSHTAFYAVYVDRGQGPEYFGLYTMVEEVDDSVIKTQYANNDGNLYKPDGDAAQLSEGSFDEDELVKKTNEDDADFSDVQALLAALHAPNRTSDPEAWRAGVDAVFDTDVFLHYLAVNGIAQNWDTYGRMSHNYFMYQAPETSLLTWIPWDNNEALQTGKRDGALPLDFSGLDAQAWPLIGFLYADPVYRETYEMYLQHTIDGPFSVASMHARYDAYEALLEPYAQMEREGFTFLRSPSDFNSACDTLRSHATSRVAATTSYLNQVD
jgi:spore coat protein H